MKIILKVLGISNVIEINPETETFNGLIIKFLSINNNDIASFGIEDNEITNFNQTLSNFNLEENSIISINITNNRLNSSISNQNLFKIRPKIPKPIISLTEKKNKNYITRSKGLRQIYFKTLPNQNDLEDLLYERLNEDNLLRGIPCEFAFEQSKFLNLLKCDICNCIFYNPKSCSLCHKNFCEECIKNEKYCFNCKKEFKQNEIDKTLKDILEILEFHCLYYKSGCKQNIKYNDFKNHVSKCDYGVFICKSENCDFKGNKFEMKKHSEKCGLLLIKCRYCNKKYERIILNSHEDKCGNRLSLCEFCKKCILLKNFEEHKNNCKMKIIVCDKCGLKFYKKDEDEHSNVICLREQIKNVKNEISIEKEKRLLIENKINQLKIKFKNIEGKI